jgi:hypothetical protein
MKKWLLIGFVLGMVIYHFAFSYLGHDIPFTQPIQPDPKPGVAKKPYSSTKGQLHQEVTLEFVHEQVEFSNDTDTIPYGLLNPAPEIRKAFIEKTIELEDVENRHFEDSILQLIVSESDSDVLESALSYLSLINSESTMFSIQQVLQKDQLSVELFSYIGEVLYEDLKYDRNTVLDILKNSISYSQFDNVDLAKLSDSLDEVFTKPNIKADEVDAQNADANDD